MDLFYDKRDDKSHEARGSQLLYWLDELGGKRLAEARPGARPMYDYLRLVDGRPFLRDWPEAREPLLRLDSVLDALSAASVRVPTPKTWRLPLDTRLPDDLTFPLFVRTALSSWKVGGRI